MYDSELLRELWSSEKTSEEIAGILGMNRRKMIQAVKKLGLPSKKPTKSLETIGEALLYSKEHTLQEAATKYGVAKSTIVNWGRKYNDMFGLTYSRIDTKEEPEDHWEPSVNVLKSVPPNLTIPRRGYGW